MKGLTQAVKPVSIPKKPTLLGRFFHIWRKRLIPKAFDLNADLPSLAILPKKASRMGGFFVSGVRVEQCDSIFQFALSAVTLNHFL
ncbi:hypothetical protein P3375_25665 [Vibrio parahaemolyticus]|nr:hypothetical protein [Vibrio parahaemolyticus]